MYEYFKPIIDNIYQLYSCWDISREDYKEHVLIVLKKIIISKQTFANDEEYLAHIEEQIKNRLDEKVKKNKRRKKSLLSNK